MKTTGKPESTPGSAARRGSKPSDDDLDPDFPIEGTGGPSDGSGGSHTGPVSPPKEPIKTIRR